MLLKWKLSRAARLIRLRSTLRSKPLLAALVKTIHVPDPNIPLYLPNDEPNPEYDAYVCTLASVIMTCPNLEALTGFYPFYNHTFDRLTHALSTRTKLRQHAWIIAENDDVNRRSQSQLPPGLLDEYQTHLFTVYHDRWKRLETLMLCSPGGHGVIEHELFIRILHSLPCLKNLCVSSFDADDFHDMTLLSLPPRVTNLRLEECLGVTDSGLTRWAASPNATQIERLMLLHQNIASLLTISKLMASLDRLQRFTIVQNDVILSLPSDTTHVVVQPVLASKSLRFLHWDISYPGASTLSGSDEHSHPTPNIHLALSISRQGFPNLRRLRAPRDTSPPGILQSVCQINDESSVLPEDIVHPYHFRDLRRSSSLRAARLRAQRITDHAAAGVTQALRPSDDTTHGSTTSNIENVPQQSQKSTSETSTSTLGSWRTRSSDVSNDTVAPNRGSEHELVSPLSPSQDHFSPLAPDDGIVSPVGADQNSMRLSTRDPDRAKIAGGLRRTHADSTKRESICQCIPDSTTDRNSICICGTDEVQPSKQGKSAKAPRLRSPHRPSHAPPVQPARTRFPSLAIRPRQQYRPVFYLTPDLPGHDGNGGLIGWGELLKISEKAKASISDQEPANEGHRSENTTPEEDSDEDEGSSGGAIPDGMCVGAWKRRIQPGDSYNELPVIKKIMSVSATATGAGGAKEKSRSKSKSKSSSRLNLSLGLRPSEKDLVASRQSWRHVARPKGDRGGSVTIADFF